MKKYIVFAIILGLFTFGFSIPKAQAVSLEDLQKEIVKLSEQIFSIKSQLLGQVVSSNPEISSLTTKSATKLNINRTLQLGSKGDDVKTLQTFLFLKNDADGIFGPVLQDKIKRWQKDNNLTVTGIVDSSTIKKMEESNYGSSFIATAPVLLKQDTCFYTMKEGNITYCKAGAKCKSTADCPDVGGWKNKSCEKGLKQCDGVVID